MKYRLLFLLVFIYSHAAFSQGFEVEKYTVDIYLNEAGYFDVVENYDLNFTESKHGIYRNILLKYDFVDENLKQQDRRIYISDIEVNGAPFEVASERKLKRSKEAEIKIGDPDKWVTGSQHYEIKYRVKNAFIFNKDQTSFYWNVKPKDWLAPFQNIQFHVFAPTGAQLTKENSFTYTGALGNNQPSDQFEYQYNGQEYSGKSKAQFVSFPGESVTLLVKLPKGMIAETDFGPSAWEEYGWMGILLLPFLLFWHYYNKYGKDTKVVSVTSYYPPKDVDPSMAGHLIDDVSDNEDLLALLPKWGSEGIIAIVDVPKKGIFDTKDVLISQLKELPSTAPIYEQTFFNGLFKRNVSDQKLEKVKNKIDDVSYPYDKALQHVLISDLKDKFYTVMQASKKELNRVAQKYYEPKSNRVMKAFSIFSLLFGFAGFFLFQYLFGIVAGISAAVVGLTLVFLSTILKKKNPAGDAALAELKGFKEFIKVADLDRLQSLVAQDGQYFEKTMSYALAFGLLKTWAGKFDALHVSPPDWYYSSAGIANMSGFSQSFSSSMNSTHSQMVSSPSSSSSGGGGSSGGGFGGGGGGSW